MQKYRIVLELLTMYQFVNGIFANGNQVAKIQAEYWSRATSYRLLNKMLKLGLIDRHQLNGTWVWYPSVKGNEFLAMWEKLNV